MSLYGCISEQTHHSTRYFNEGDFYVEQFVRSGGAHASDWRSFYITDSINFREYIGDVDDKEYFKFEFDSVIIIVTKFSRRNRYGKNPLLLETTEYNVNSMKQNGL